MRLATGNLLLALLFLGSLGSRAQVAQKVPLPIAAMEPYPRPVPPFVALGDSLIFVAGENRHYSLWLAQPRGGTVTRLIGPETFPFEVVLSQALGLAFFHRTEGEETVLWRTDGTVPGTYSLGLRIPPSLSRFRPGVVEENGQAFTVGLTATGLELFRIDGTAAGTQPLGLPLPDSKWVSTPGAAALGGLTYFLVNTAAGPELWRSDGSAAGTEKVTVVLGDFQGFFSGEADDRLFFVAYWSFSDFPYFSEDVWTTDGTAEGTVSLKANTSSVSHFLPADGATLFLDRGYDLEYTTRLMSTDGTPEGTRRVIARDFKPSLSGPQLILFEGRYYLEDLSGIWVTDGSAAGTYLVWPYPYTFYEAEDACFRTLGATTGKLFALLPTADNHCQLWASDDPDSGFQLLREFELPRIQSFRLRFTTAGDRIYFLADDGRHGLELWTSDGTPAGTQLAHDLYPQEGSSNPLHFLATDDYLVFTAEDGLTGPDLWALDLDEKAPSCRPRADSLCLQADRFRVEARWRDFRDRTGAGQAVELTDDTGTFWFFRDTNIELALKILDGRANNGHFWVFYGSLSNVDFDLTVTDTETGQVKVYRNRSRQFASVGDTKAF